MMVATASTLAWLILSASVWRVSVAVKVTVCSRCR